MSTSSPWKLPLLRATDVVIVGASTAAVAAALELRRLGRDVFVLSDRPYLGEDTAGTLALWPDAAGAGEDPLAMALERERQGALLTPGAAKRVLEQALVEAGVRFLFLTRPVALLRDPEGRPGGVVLAHRSSLFALRASQLVDATEEGLLARLAGATPIARADADSNIEWNVIASRAPAHVPARGLGSPFEVPSGPKPMEVSLHALRLTRPTGDRREALHHLRAGVLDLAVRQFADQPLGLENEVFARGAREFASTPEALPDAAFALEEGLWLASGALPLSEAGATALRSVRAHCALGRRVAGLLLAARTGSTSGANARMTAEAGGSFAAGCGFVPAFLRDEDGALELEEPLFPDWGSWDVVVAGGGTAGAPAGASAAREGARTLVLEVQTLLGGVGTAGLISQYWFGRRGGYTHELDERMRALDPERKQKASWSPELKAALHHRLLADAGGSAWMRSFVFGARRAGDRVDGVLISTPYGSGFVRAGCVVDASGSADVAAAVGAPCREVGREHAAVQGTGLSPRSPGRDYCNSDHTFTDDNDPEGVTHAHVRARAKFRDEFDVATFLDSRERRQIVGDLELNALDVLAGRTFPDTVYTAHSNFDTHGFTVHPVFMIAPPDKRPLDAHVPLRAMLPRGIDGVVVTGLGISAHRDAFPVIRMQADVQNQGYAAGLIAAQSARAGLPLRHLDLRAVQRALVEKGALDADVPGHADSFPLPEARLREAIEAGSSDFRHAAVIFAHSRECRELLLARLNEPASALETALTLGMMGDAAAAPVLLEHVRSTPWDDGWNYRGMHQFGASMSRLDAAVIALGRTRHPEAAAVIAQKVRELDAETAFSHARAVGVASVCLRSSALAAPLEDLLRQPRIAGHAETTTEAAIRRALPDHNEDRPRSLALRELYLARGLLAAGDPNGLARTTLETYARDLRSVLARHARAILEGGLPSEPLEVA